MQLQDKVIVITGSTRGIGRAAAEACAAEGARVVVSSRNEQAVRETVDALKQRGFSVSGIRADVTLHADLERLLQHAIQTWGRVDVWVNNAGVSSGLRPLEEISEEEITEVVSINLVGTLKACRLVIPYFQQAGGGIIINLTGKGGRGEASGFTAVYACTKAAITSLTKSLAEENKTHRISIHAALPGMVATDFYKDMKTSPRLATMSANVPYVLDAIGVPLEVAGRLFVTIAAQEPGKVTGKVYSAFSGMRMMRGMTKLMRYRAGGKLK